MPAFDELYQAEFGFVWRTVGALGATGSVRDDIVQEVCLVVHKRLDAFEPRGSLRGWLYGIVRLVVSRERRTRRRKREPRRHAGTDLDAFEDAGTRGPEELAERAEAVETLDRLLGGLTNKPGGQTGFSLDIKEDCSYPIH